MNVKERFDLANELVERISSEPEFDAFFIRFYNGKTLGLDDDPIGEFEKQEKLNINKVYTKDHRLQQIQVNRFTKINRKELTQLREEAENARHLIKTRML